nr:DUF2156 domain-containing protein [Micromonospora sp. DSM 115978]
MVTRDDTTSHDVVLNQLRRYSDNPSGFLALNTGNDFFTDPVADGFVAFRLAGRHLVQFGGPVAAAADRGALLQGFLDYARARRRQVVAVQLQRADAEVYAELGFAVNQFGSSYSLRLADFTLRGTRFMKLRNKISRARRSGLDVAELPFGECVAAVTEIDAEWLRGKGRHVKEIEFLVGETGGPVQPHRRVFVGTVDGAAVAYISYSPAYGSQSGWLHDLSRRRPQVPPGTMEAINLQAVETFQREGAQWLHFGFTPFTGLLPELELSTAGRITAGFMRMLGEHGEKVYPAASQLAYKQKWNPQSVYPEYLAFQ